MAPQRSKPAAEHPIARVLAQVLSHPGITLTDLRESAGLGWGTLYHYLRKMEAAGSVRVEKRGHYRCIFPVGEQFPVSEAPARAWSRSKFNLCATLLRIGPATVPALVTETGMSRRMVYHHLQALRKAGFVERGEGRHTFAATDKLQHFLQERARRQETKP